LALGPEGTLYISDVDGHRVRAVAGDTIQTVAGGGNVHPGVEVPGAGPTGYDIGSPFGVAVGADGTLYITNPDSERIYSVAHGQLSPFPSNASFSITCTTSADCLPSTLGLAVSPEGNLYVADPQSNTVRVVGADGIIRVVAGTPDQSSSRGTVFSGDGDQADHAVLNGPVGVAFGPDRTLYVADTNNNRVRAIGPDGVIRTIAGTDKQGVRGNGVPATQAELARPLALTVGSDGTVYIADSKNNLVRAISTDGILRTVIG
jgi:sugar lactone lactonase YvrE